MNTTERIAGYECHLLLSKDGQHIRAMTIMVGPPDKPGWRAKDEARNAELRGRRRAAKAKLVDALAADPRAAWILAPSRKTSKRRKLICVASRYSCLTPCGDGMLARRDDTGHVIGVHPC